jgi:hypothetical protein
LSSRSGYEAVLHKSTTLRHAVEAFITPPFPLSHLSHLDLSKASVAHPCARPAFAVLLALFAARNAALQIDAIPSPFVPIFLLSIPPHYERRKLLSAFSMTSRTAVRITAELLTSSENAREIPTTRYEELVHRSKLRLPILPFPHSNDRLSPRLAVAERLQSRRYRLEAAEDLVVDDALDLLLFEEGKEGGPDGGDS